MIQPLFEHRLKLAGYETRVLELEGDGPPFVMFHGYADSADTWRHALALLARHGRRAVAVDLPGSGTADPLLPDPILPQLDAFAAAALRYAAGRPADRAACTCSWHSARGGRSSQRLVHRGAELVLSAVPGARLELLPGIGHCPQVEAPARLIELLLDFTGAPGRA